MSISVSLPDGGVEAARERYLSPDQVCELVPVLTKGQLAQWRFLSAGPRYRKLGRKVVYVESEVIEFVESTARYGTAAEAV
ncbi:helix-turn-helix transcriptional regulator [Glaciibacter psychrotolerans]|uniref:Putative DNA-binding transcriptional regulator AlpA n=1 Tax=Glaciibacter psychrotolerans TaxID=670054 RepID=A0A7Z0J817_9MICO|nr:hypothetical protein [Leifsonia psychrotolerans]NYJ21454.1 putative DNA-binding transcriptional regulator AlpA [Leifsonia psychrotolerans]